MKNSYQTEKLMRDIEHTVRERPKDSVYMLSFFLMVGEALTITMVYLFCYRFGLQLAMVLILSMLFIMAFAVVPIEQMVANIASLYQVEDYRKNLLRYWPPFLAITLITLMQLGIPGLTEMAYFLVCLGPFVLIIVSVLIYATNYCCERFADNGT